MFLNMSYSANSCSHCAVSNAHTKVTKKPKHTNSNQNITANSKFKKYIHNRGDSYSESIRSGTYRFLWDSGISNMIVPLDSRLCRLLFTLTSLIGRPKSITSCFVKIYRPRIIWSSTQCCVYDISTPVFIFVCQKHKA